MARRLKVGDRLVLTRVPGGWFTTGQSMSADEAERVMKESFAAGMSEENDGAVVEVASTRQREFDPR